ncbi:enoyl-CoA hydratase-related protein [Candidatus Poriferisocius sp.]|uniref:enoyl-CoA hydratase-related protein n=1 Tax=Candidatus Poriferisocius sp. TaxID=3101276 RepID=UPI003B02B679
MADQPGADAVLFEVSDGVAWVTINRPEARNAVNQAVTEGLAAAWDRVESDDDIAVAVLTGAGEAAFSAGADLKEMAARAERGLPSHLAGSRLAEGGVTKPVIAAVNGLAYAFGFNLVMQCDLCVAADHARFGILEAKVGRGSPWAAQLGWLIPPRTAMELLCTAEPISAQRAYELGLVNKVVPAADLKSAAAELAKTIAANAPLTVRAGKAMIRATAGLSPAEAAAVADEIYAPVYSSDDAQEGPRAFAEKRPPRWQGR